MKTILFLFSFMFVSCVTANPESRDLSAVNTEPELSSFQKENTTININLGYVFYKSIFIIQNL